MPGAGVPWSMAQPMRRDVAPGASQVLGRLLDRVGDRVDGGALPGPAHLHVGQLPASAVLVDMGPPHGGPLGAMDGDGVAVGQVGGVELVGAEALEAPVVHGGGQLAAADVDGQHRAALRGHDLPAGTGGQGDDAVPGPVAGLADDQLLARQPSELAPTPHVPGGSARPRWPAARRTWPPGHPWPRRRPSRPRWRRGPCLDPGTRRYGRRRHTRTRRRRPCPSAAAARAARSAWSTWRTFSLSTCTAPRSGGPRPRSRRRGRRRTAGGDRRRPPPWPRSPGPPPGRRPGRRRRSWPPRRARRRGGATGAGCHGRCAS